MANDEAGGVVYLELFLPFYLDDSRKKIAIGICGGGRARRD